MQRVRLYARVSHANGDQDPEVQLRQLRQHAEARGWQVVHAYVDRASAINLKRRPAWSRLLREAQQGEVVLVWRLDRAFRSVLHAMQDVETLKARGVALVSATEPFDLTSPMGEAMFGMLAVFAQLERGVIRERIRAGQDKARAHGTRTGRPIGRPRGWSQRRGGYLDPGQLRQYLAGAICINGHDLTNPEHWRWKDQRRGTRVCRICARERARRLA